MARYVFHPTVMASARFLASGVDHCRVAVLDCWRRPEQETCGQCVVVERLIPPIMRAAGLEAFICIDETLLKHSMQLH